MTVLVTGAAGAIGRACAEKFLACDEPVIAQDLDASSWSGTPGVTPLSGDLSDTAFLEQLNHKVRGGALRCVVAAHGIAGSATLADCEPAFVDRVLTVNMLTVPLLFGAVRDGLAASRGAFVAVASQAALVGEAGNTAYCAAKFALVGWIRAMAAQEQQLTLHALCPGATDSPLLRAAQRSFAAAEGVAPGEYYQHRARQIAVGRYGRPQEIAAAAAYLSASVRRPVVLAVTGGDVLL